MNKFPCLLERVSDGDTFVIREAVLGFSVKTGMRRIRVKDFLAPDDGEPGCRESTDAARVLLTSTKTTIMIAPFEDRMSYDRYVCDVFLYDGDGAERLFRDMMVAQGHGHYIDFYKRGNIFLIQHPKRGVIHV